jgi:hypothetical protein
MTGLKPLLIQGPVDDLGDVLQIARAEGCKALGVDKVTVIPEVIRRENSYVVFVIPKGVCLFKTERCSSESKEENERNKP